MTSSSTTPGGLLENTGPGSNLSNGTGQGRGWTADSFASALHTPDPTSPMSSGDRNSPHDSDNLFLGHANMTDLQTVLDCGVLPVVSLLGVVGNCLCVVVFLRQRYQSVARPLLLALCASDILFLLSTFIVSLPCIVRKVNEENGHAMHVHVMPQLDVFRDVMSRVTVMITLAIGVERSVAVTRPLKLRGLCSVPRTRTAVLVICLCVLALKSPAFFYYDVRHHVKSDNVTTLELHKTKFYLDNQTMLDFYFDYFLLVILQGLPFISICVCFIIVLVSLKRRLQCACPRTPKFGAFARAKGRRLSNSGETEHADLVLEERKLTRALLVVILLCVLSELPSLVVNLFQTIQPKSKSELLSVSCDVSRLLSVLNSAVNFVVFMGLYKHFSVTFKSLAGLC